MRNRTRPIAVCSFVFAGIFASATGAPAQHVHAPDRVPADSAIRSSPGLRLSVGAHAVPLLTRASPMLRGATMTEAYLTQPSLLFGIAYSPDNNSLLPVVQDPVVGDPNSHEPVVHDRDHARRAPIVPRFGLIGTVSLEPLTIRRGELGAGMHGEGYVDRRHPHTWLHEIVAWASGDIDPTPLGTMHASIAAGRGFVPFGTDDPMTRPFVKFPVNHHLGQVLERLFVSGGLRLWRVMMEAALFDGAEPYDATDFGSFDRLGNSWSARTTLFPVHGLELQASRAHVESPEMHHGGGWDQRKWSASARWQAPLRTVPVYALVEWKRTTMMSSGRDLFSFGSVLAETELRLGAWRPALRIERSERPEEERLFDPFRSPWPHGGGHVLGITQWTIVAARVQRDFAWRHGTIAPFVEASYSAVRETAGGVFDPAELYGGTGIRTFNIGARVGMGAHRPRMGRYGVAAPAHQHEDGH